MGNSENVGWNSLKPFIVKSAIAVVAISLGVAIGIYTGAAFTGSNIGGLTADQLPNNSLIEIGETFPDYTFSEISSGKEIKLSQITAKGPAVLIFVSSTCKPCQIMATYWNKKVVRGLREDIQIVLVFDEDEVESSGYQEDHLAIEGAMIVKANRFDQSTIDGITSTPSFAAIDKEQKVRFITSGFRKDIDSEFINDYL